MGAIEGHCIYLPAGSIFVCLLVFFKKWKTLNAIPWVSQ